MLNAFRITRHCRSGFACAIACRAAKTTGLLFTKDMTIYVSDFELDVQNVQVDQGSAVGSLRPGILERPSKKEQKDPEAQAKELVDMMSQSIVSDLQKAGYKAQRLGNDDPKPTLGAWVHGIFYAG
jgi:hypothetical protein